MADKTTRSERVSVVQDDGVRLVYAGKDHACLTPQGVKLSRSVSKARSGVSTGKGKLYKDLLRKRVSLFYAEQGASFKGTVIDAHIQDSMVRVLFDCEGTVDHVKNIDDAVRRLKVLTEKEDAFAEDDVVRSFIHVFVNPDFRKSKSNDDLAFIVR